MTERSFQEGETFFPSVCELREGKTCSPNLLTEADLVNLMDKNGIGESEQERTLTIIDEDLL
jgi:DNA topoisomerase IA